MSKQFHHRNNHKYNQKGGYTVYVDTPNHSFFKKMLLWNEKNTTLKVGVAICSTEDQFCKKVGRTISELKVENVQFELSEVKFRGEYSVFMLYSATKRLALTFKCKMDHEASHLISANYYDCN